MFLSTIDVETDFAAERRRFNRVFFAETEHVWEKNPVRISGEILLIKPEMSRLYCYISLYEFDMRP